MRVILFGATGMIGGGALRECLLAADVDRVLTVGRAKTGQTHEKLRELVVPDLTDFRAIAGELAGYDACFFCIGVTSAGRSEAEYRRITHDTAVAASKALVETNPAMTFVFVSAAGTDATSKRMWQHIKGEAENAILALPFRGAYVVRPAIVRPMHGSTSRTLSYRLAYAVIGPLMPAIASLAPRYFTTTERVGRAMLNLVRRGFPKRVLESDDINVAAEG